MDSLTLFALKKLLKQTGAVIKHCCAIRMSTMAPRQRKD